MDDHIRERLQEDMKRRTESARFSEDMLTSVKNRYGRGKVVRHRILATCGAFGVVILAAGLVFGVALARGGDPSAPKVAAKGTASASTTTVVADKKALAITYLRRTLAVTASAEGEILHVKTRNEYASVDLSDPTVESWSTGDETKWMWRRISTSTMMEQDDLCNYPSTYLTYIRRLDFPGVAPVQSWDATTSAMRRLTADSDFVKIVQSMIDSGEATEDGHVQIDGRDAVRVVSEVTDGNGGYQMVVFFDARTSKPIEYRYSVPNEPNQGFIVYYDVYETLPATAENLKVFDAKAFHPGVPVQKGVRAQGEQPAQ